MTTIHSASPETLTNASLPDGETARDRIKRTTEEARERVAGQATELRETASETADRAIARAGEGVEELRAGLNEAGRMAREGVEKQPLVAVAGALAVGVVLGMALSRSRS